MRHEKGQGLLEFALVIPIILLIVMGTIDFGRILTAYAMVSNSLRAGLRNATVYGYPGEANYRNCALMEEDIQRVMFTEIIDSDIDIRFVKSNDPDTLYTCSDLPRGKLETGDLILINVRANIGLITPLIANMFPTVSLNFGGERTVVLDIPLNRDDSNDTDHDWLADDWETAWFGDLSASATGNTGDDLCNNGAEESRGTNPLADDCVP